MTNERTVIVIESKRPDDDFIRRIHTLVRTGSGWDFTVFARGMATESFSRQAAECEACGKLVAALEDVEASWLLGE